MESRKKRSGFLLLEDYWAIWIGMFLLVIGLICFYFIPLNDMSEKVEAAEQIMEHEKEKAPFNTITWQETKAAVSQMSSAKTPQGTFFKNLLRSPQTWKSNPIKGFYQPAGHEKNVDKLQVLQDSLNQLKSQAVTTHELAASQQFDDPAANKLAAVTASQWRETHTEFQALKKKSQNKGYFLAPNLLVLSLVFALIFGVGAHYMGFGFWTFVKGFLFVFLLAILAQLLGQQIDMKAMGFGYAIWAIALGLLISNTLGTPDWVKSAVRPEFYIKTGLVLLGTEILFTKILAIGMPGIFVAWIVTPIVLLGTYWFGQRVLKIASKSLNITICADMSVCGVSAAIATAAASKATKEELTMAVGMSMAFTSVMMIALPAFIKFVGMPEVLGGAWIGGTIDASGAVVAAGALLGETALQVAATIKIIQNMLIGVISFFVAYYWATQVDKKEGVKVRAGEIWDRFPKFILGFVGASLLISLLYSISGSNLGDALIDLGLIRGYSKDLSSWMFCLAFVSIGLSVNFKELWHQFKGGKPMYLYLVGQAFNLALTLLVAYIMFYILFPEITQSL